MINPKPKQNDENIEKIIEIEIEALKKIRLRADELIGVCTYCITTKAKILSQVISHIYLFQIKMLEEFLNLIELKHYYSANLVAGILFENYIYLSWILLDEQDKRAELYWDYAKIYTILEPNVSKETLKNIKKFIKDDRLDPLALSSYNETWHIDNYKGKKIIVSIKSMCKRIGERYKKAGGTDISERLQRSYGIYCSFKHCEPMAVINHNWGSNENTIQKQSATQLAYISLLSSLKITYTYFHPKDDMDCKDFDIFEKIKKLI